MSPSPPHIAPRRSPLPTVWTDRSRTFERRVHLGLHESQRECSGDPEEPTLESSGGGFTSSPPHVHRDSAAEREGLKADT